MIPPPKPPAPVPLTVGLYDYQNLGAATDRSMEAAIGKILGQAGIAPQWSTYVKGPHGLTGPDTTNAITLAFTQRPSGNPAARLSADAMGSTPRGSTFARVYYPDIQALVRQNQSLNALQLASFAAAHEIGHALGLGHAPAGIMTGHWDANQMARYADHPWNMQQRNVLLAAVQRLMSQAAAQQKEIQQTAANH